MSSRGFVVHNFISYRNGIVRAILSHGELDFGPWEKIFYGEFDGGRRKRVLVKVIGE